MADAPLHVVTGAFGYSGKYIARRLLERSFRVKTLTNSLPSPASPAIERAPLSFDDPDALARSLEGADVLYNTYWVRFNHVRFNHSGAVENTLRLFQAAGRAGVRRIVHVSITNPSETSPLEYFQGKAVLESALRESGISHAILRPTVLFGKEDILINNICWMLRRFPIMGVFGDGEYKLQPIYVDDLARLAVEQGARTDNQVINAIGPETFTFRDMVASLAEAIGVRRPIVSIPPALGFWVGKVLGWLVGDVVITRPEIEGLMAGLLHVDAPAAGETRLTLWAREHADTLGERYANELSRRR